MKFNKKDAFPMVRTLRAKKKEFILSALNRIFLHQSITFLAKKCNVQHIVDSFCGFVNTQLTRLDDKNE